jgi:hypothetical protein
MEEDVAMLRQILDNLLLFIDSRRRTWCISLKVQTRFPLRFNKNIKINEFKTTV